jgi:hypothetical protein
MRLDGRYSLVTSDCSLSADELSRAYKRQHLIESRFTDLKGPIRVRPVFLHSNRRIAALLAVISLALLLYGLIERQVRRALAGVALHERRLLECPRRPGHRPQDPRSALNRGEWVRPLDLRRREQDQAQGLALEDPPVLIRQLAVLPSRSAPLRWEERHVRQ